MKKRFAFLAFGIGLLLCLLVIRNTVRRSNVEPFDGISISADYGKSDERLTEETRRLKLLMKVHNKEVESREPAPPKNE